MRLGVLIGVLAAVSGPRQMTAQSGSPFTIPAAATSPAKGNVKRVPVSKAVFGDAAVIVNARDDGFIEVAAAGTSKTVLLQLRAMAARAWMDSTSRMLRARIRKADASRSLRADISEYGTTSSMAVIRKVTGTQSEYALYFADNAAGGVTVPIEASEADVFVAIVRKAIAQSVKFLDKPDTAAKVDSAPPKKKPVRRVVKPKADSTAAKPAATPPVAKPATTTPPKPATTTPPKPATTTPPKPTTTTPPKPSTR